VRLVTTRLLMLPVSLLAIITASFFLFAALPGDIPHAMLGQIATPEAIARLKERLGLDQSVFERFYHYIGDLSHGSLGESYYTGTGFPRVFYLAYHLYRDYFPLLALTTYKRMMEKES